MNIYTLDQLAKAILKALYLGKTDEKRSNPDRTGKQIVDQLGIESYRMLHLDLIKRAYTIGRKSYGYMQKDGRI